MLSEKLKELRNKNHFTQDYLANELHVTRQTVAKWESGISVPDIYALKDLAKLYDVSLDALMDSEGDDVAPKDKYIFGYIKVEKNGYIKLPEEALRVFGLHEGSSLIALGDTNQGLAFVSPESMEEFAKKIMEEKEKYENN